MSPWLGRFLMLTSGMGFPLAQVAIRRMGRGGAVLAEGVAAGLLARDVALIAMGIPQRLYPGPARLLFAETAAAAGAVALGLPLLGSRDPWARAGASRPGPLEAMRRFAIGTLFGLHSWRLRIYLSPSRGLRPVEPTEPMSSPRA
jgi:hypothetical protein